MFELHTAYPIESTLNDSGFFVCGGFVTFIGARSFFYFRIYKARTLYYNDLICTKSKKR